MSVSMSHPNYHLGIDLGTQSVKIVLCSSKITDDEHPTCHVEAVGHSSDICMLPCGDSHHNAEQDPTRWIGAIKEACHDLEKSFSTLYTKPMDASNIRSVAVSGHQHGLVLLDKFDNIVRPCMMWCDTRASTEARELSIYSGFVCPPGFTAPKIMWLKNNEPQCYKLTSKIMLPHDYINYYLSGFRVHVMERGDASGTGIFCNESNTFNKDLVEFIDQDLSQKLPPIVCPHDCIGLVDPDIFRSLFSYFSDAKNTCTVLMAPGSGDNAMSALAISSLDCADPSSSPPLFLSLGTSGTLCTMSTSAVVDRSGSIAPFCDCTGNYLPLLCIQNCSLVPEEVRKIFPNIDIDEITALAASEPPGCEGLLVLPYFSEGGERSPNWPNSSAAFLGLRHGHFERPGLLYRAALESVAYSLLRGYRSMIDSGLPEILNTKIHLVGGGSKNSLWRQIIADVFRIPVVIDDEEITSKASAVGAALQATAIAYGVSVGRVVLGLKNRRQSLIYPVSDENVRDAYESSLQRHISISNKLFKDGEQS